MASSQSKWANKAYKETDEKLDEMRSTYMNGFIIDEEADNERRSTDGMDDRSQMDQGLISERARLTTRQVDVETLNGDLEEINDNTSANREESRGSARYQRQNLT